VAIWLEHEHNASRRPLTANRAGAIVSRTEAVPAAAAAPHDRKLRWWLQRLLTHPLLLLVVGGVISGLAATFVSQRWQDHQRAIDTRRAFVSEMTRTVMTDLVALDRFAGALAGYPTGGRAELDRQRAAADAADARWAVDAFTIRARAAAYYPASGVSERWTALYSQVEQWWADEQSDYQAIGPRGIGDARYRDFKSREWPIIQATQRVAALVLHS
jgi:hypothetical protein